MLAAGCVFLDVRKQQEKLDAACEVRGSVRAEDGEHAMVVVLARRAGERWQIADHFVLEQPGRWTFAFGAGTYRLAAFQDRNNDLVYQPGEPLVYGGRQLACTSGETFDELALLIPAKGGERLDRSIDVAALQARTPRDQLTATLGQLTAVGELAALTDARFSQAQAESGLWRPFDFLFDARAGVYFLEPYDARRIPVLFVHGINGTPANFAALAAGLDRRRFQPWVYYYPSGAHLGAVADHLTQTITKLHVRHDFRSLVVVAHSMGGLVARGFILRHQASGARARIPLFMSISTPWSGHKGAAIGVATAPVVVRVWEDMAPGSEYQQSLFAAPLPAGTAHHLVFTPNDQTVTRESQLRPEAQRDAARVHGFDDSHMGVLNNTEVAELLNKLLAAVD